jgi:DNA polymerase III delta subunit
MIYAIVGDNLDERKKVLEKLKAQHPFELRTQSADTVDLNEISSMVSSDGLFGDSYLLLLQDVLAEDTISNYLQENMEDLRTSSTVFCLIEEKMGKPIQRKFEFKSSELIELPKKVKKEESFNLFSLTDTLASGDKKNLWVQYQKALKAGKTAEEISPILLWQLKSLVLAQRSPSASESGMKPFVYNKAARSPLALERSQKAYKDLLAAYHESRRGKNLSDELEKILLKL